MANPEDDRNSSKYKRHLHEGREGLSQRAQDRAPFYRKRIKGIRKMYEESTNSDCTGSGNLLQSSNEDPVSNEISDSTNNENKMLSEESLHEILAQRLLEIRKPIILREDELLFHKNISKSDLEMESENVQIDEYLSQRNHLQEIMDQLEYMVECVESQDEDKDNFEKFLEDPKFFEAIKKQVDRSPAEILLMVLTFSLHSKLPVGKIQLLIRMINALFCDSVLPESKYMLDKIFNKIDHCEFHAVCPDCDIYIGHLKDEKDSVTCKICNKKMDLSNPSLSHFFLIIDPSEYISDYLQQNEDYFVDVLNGKYESNENIKDIYNGEYYKKFLESLSEDERKNYATAIFNTDGAPCFKSSQFSIWPIYLQINELPPQERLRCAIPTALYVGPKKPDMMNFLPPFVDKMNKKSTDGIQVTIKEENRLIKLYPLIACADAVARAPMQGMMQYNGYYGCGWCKHEGEHDGSMRFPILNLPKPPLRDMKSHVEAAELASKPDAPADTCLFGVKYLSPLANLHKFDVIRGFTPDYMHFYVMGVASQFTEYYLKHLSKDDLKILDEIMLSFAVPNQICRLSRPLSQRQHWKAKEWENWVLYYSLPILELILTDRAFKHWALLVDSLHILLGMEISFEKLRQADKNLTKFVEEAESIYTILVLTNNVHQLLHVCQSVIDWGPVWAHSNFVFESANAILLKSIHSANGVNLQILRYINLQHCQRILKHKVYPQCDSIIKRYCEDVEFSRVQKSFKMSSVRYFGKQKCVKDDCLAKFSLSILHSQVFNKIVKERTMYSQKVNRRSCNSYILLHDGRFVKCQNFVVDTEHNKEVTLCNIVNTSKYAHSEFILEVTSINEENESVKTSDIKKVCVFLQVGKQKFICPVANTLYY